MKGTINIYSNMHGPQNHHFKRNKPDTKGCILYDSIYVTFWKGKTFGTEVGWWFQRQKGLTSKGAQYKRGLLGVLEMFYTEGVEVTETTEYICQNLIKLYT